MTTTEQTVGAGIPVPYPMQSRQDTIVAGELEHDLGTLRRDYGPVIPALMPFGEGNAWIAVGYEEVRQVMSDERFVVWKHRGNNYPRLRFNEGNRPPFRMAFDKMDGPEQIARRRVLAKHLSARRVMGMKEETRNKVEAFLDGFIAGGQGSDLIPDFVEHVPLAVISDLLGVPAEETDIFLEAALDHMNGRITSEEQANAHINKVNAYFDHLVARRHEEPGDDLISALLNDVGGTWDDEELGGVGFVLLTAGHDSTASIIGGILYWLAHDPVQFRNLKDNRELLPRAIEEFLRVVPAGTGTRVRIATEDVEIGGVLVKKDEGIHPLVHPANFDESVFENPDQLNFDREGDTHLRFGFGSHACPGNQLARMEIREVLEAVLNRFATLEPAAPVENWRERMLMRGPKELKVNWTLEEES